MSYPPPPPGPPYYMGGRPPPPPFHLPPGSFTYLPMAYSYPQSHWPQESYTSTAQYTPQYLPPSTQPYLQPPSTQPYLPPSTQPYSQAPSTQQYPQPSSTRPYSQPPSTQLYPQLPSTRPYSQPPSTQQYLEPSSSQYPQPSAEPYVPPSSQPYLEPTSEPYVVQPPSPTRPQSYGVNIVELPTEVPEYKQVPVFAPDEEVISWVPATPTTAQTLEYKAVVGGKEGYDFSPLWVIRAHHKGELIPGKLAVKHRYAFIPSAGKEVPVHNFEVLCTKPGAVQWVSSRDGQVPEKAVVAGNTINAEPLYIGRASHKWSVTPGKISPAHGCLYISYGGNEISLKKYEVLCQV